MKPALSLLFCVFALTGCTTRLTDFTVISTKNVDFSQLAKARRCSTRVKGKDTVHVIILFPTGVASMKEAIDKAIESVPGAVALVDGVLYHNWFYIPYIYGQDSYVVEGTPLIVPSLVMRSPERWMVAKYDPAAKRCIMHEVSEQQFEKMRRGMIGTGAKRS